MSKQHTPTKWIVQDGLNEMTITNKDKNVSLKVSGIDSRQDRLDYAFRLIKSLDNHERLVEALDTLVNTANDGVYGDHYSAWVVAKQLLTELKS